MQWGKSKTYIIIAFIVVNLVLLMSIFKEKTQYKYEFSKKNLNNLKTLLESKNIRYDMKLDTNTSHVHPISILYARPKDKIYKKINDKYSDKINVIDDVYVDLNINKKISNKDELSDFAENFVKENFNKKKYILKESLEQGENIMITYEEQYKGVRIEQGYIKFIYSPDNNINVSILKIKEIDEMDAAMNVISNSQALSKMLPQLKKGDKIISMDRCYNFIEEDSVSNTDKREAIRLLPFYRAKLQNGNFIYVGAVKNK